MERFGHYAKAIAFAKLSLWVTNYNSQKRAKVDSGTALQLLCARNSSQKNIILKK